MSCLVLFCTALAYTQEALPVKELLVWQMHKIAGEERIADLQSNEDGPAFLHALEHNEVWMHEILDSGPVENGAKVLQFLYEIWKSDPALVANDIDRSMATACALAMGMRELDATWMTQRHDWFRDSWDAGLLNSGYGDLNTFERRFIARGLQRPSWTTVDALEYLNETISVPRQQFAKTAWRSPYRGHNAFGDTVQGPTYYMPFKETWRSDAEMAVKVGGVCGSLSHVGAASAIASGIPALTMGEPGHCAYAVQTKPHVWQPAYSLSWKRGLHTTMTRNTWPSLELSQLAMADSSTAFLAGDARRKAFWLEEKGDVQSADAAWQSACAKNPLDEMLWQEYALFGTRNNWSRIGWIQFFQNLQTALLPEHPEPAWHLLSTHVFPRLLEDAEPAKYLQVFKIYIGALDGWGPSRWNIEGALDWAWDGSSSDASKSTLLHTTLKTLINDSKLGPAMVAWSLAKVKGKPELEERFKRSLLEQAGGEGEGPSAVLAQLAKNMLPAAAEERDLDTFQRIGKTASALYEPRQTLAEMNIEPFDGELLSSGGALRIFNPGNRWDSPEKHWGVLEEYGGWFHTDNGDLPWFEVELPKFGNLTGVILDSRVGQPGRAKGVRILVSEDGQAWTEVGKTNSGKPQQRIDLQETNPLARFVRFERDGQCLHYHRILIYGDPAS